MSNPLLWQPSQAQIKSSRLHQFMLQAKKRHAHELAALALEDAEISLATSQKNYALLHKWSVTQIESFWQEIWHFCEIKSTHSSMTTVSHADKMLGVEWFPDALLNFSENLLHAADQTEALVFRGEDKIERRLTRAELAAKAASLAAALRELGVNEGDRVAAYMPNMPETLIVMLATASIGAVFSSASPDFGVQGVLDRFSQIQPKVLVTVDGYFYNGKTIDILDKVREVSNALAASSQLQHTIMVGYINEKLDDSHMLGIHHAKRFDDHINAHLGALPQFAQLPFNHPLYILFSSGTTGIPKCIVHSVGGTLIQHLKEHQLQADIRAGDRVFFFTTCGWMMWNWLMTGLASRATLMLYDGSPLLHRGAYLFDYAEQEKFTHFGTSAKFIDAIAKNKLSPITTHRLEHLRVLLSSGSTLTPEGFDFVYTHIKKDMCLSSMSGGTDIISCFVGGAPILPVRRGEIQCAGLGMAVATFDEHGQAHIGKAGELVCTKPFPSMPLGFYNDPNDEKYHAAYFEAYPNVWCHGDYTEITPEGGVIIYGRSDTTLNPGGVRIGTAEIYRQVEKLEEVLESLVVGQLWKGDERVILFVRLRDGLILDETIQKKIIDIIKINASPRHVPAKIVQVADIPRTRSGKIVEQAVKNLLHDRPIKNKEALANPEALQLFVNHPALQQD